MKIRKYIGGGFTYTPTTGSEGAAKQAASSSDSDALQKAFFNKLLDIENLEGLSNDVNAGVTKMQSYLRNPLLLTDPSKMNEAYLESVKIANAIKTNYADYKKAYDRLESQDAWSEVAYDSRGKIWCTDGKNIFKVDPTNPPEDKEFIPITNAELVQYRRTVPSMVLRDDVFDDMSNVVGTQTIISWAEDRISKFKSTELKGFAAKKGDKIEAGMLHLIEGDQGDFLGTLREGPNGIYTINQTATIVDSGIEEALKYLLSTMPNSYKNALVAKASVEGYNPEAMLLTMLASNTGRKITADYAKSESAAAGFSEAEEKLSDHDTYAIRIASGDGNPVRIPLNIKAKTPGETTAFSVVGIRQGKLRNYDNKPIEYNDTLDKLIRNLGAADACIVDNITFGDIVLKPGEDRGIIWDGISELSEVWLPYTIKDGIITPDWELLKRFEEFKKEAGENMSTVQLNELLRKHGINPSMVEPFNGNYRIKPTSQNVKLFVTFSGIASSKNLEGLKDSLILDKLDKDEQDNYKNLYKNLVQYGKESRTKSAVKNSDMSAGGSLYRGNIFMPVDSYYVAAHQSRNQNVSKSDMTRFSETSQLLQTINDARDEDISTAGQFKD